MLLQYPCSPAAALCPHVLVCIKTDQNLIPCSPKGLSLPAQNKLADSHEPQEHAGRAPPSLLRPTRPKLFFNPLLYIPNPNLQASSKNLRTQSPNQTPSHKARVRLQYFQRFLWMGVGGLLFGNRSLSVTLSLGSLPETSVSWQPVCPISR